MITKEINLKDKPIFWLGDRFYKVEEKIIGHSYSRTYKEFSSKCPCCDDTRKVKATGNNGKIYETDCPVCKGSIGSGRGNSITVYDWEVHEYIINKIVASGPETVSVYKDGNAPMNCVDFMAFHKYGRCSDDCVRTRVPWFEEHVDVDIKETDSYNTLRLKAEDYVFRNKKDAEKFCKILKDFDRKRLKEFNEKFGTDYEYPF